MFPRMQLLALLASVLLAFRQSACRSDMLSLRMMHRFSAEAHDFWSRKYAGSVSGERAAAGTPDFYRLLHRQDRRRLATTDEPLSFSSGNETMDYGEEFRWLHYAVIDIGTPNTSFLVALDTGSDLLWVPCECKQCASISASSQQLLDMPLNVYSPAASKTSKHVTCDNSLCDSSSTCESKSDDCLYNVQYVSDDTSTSGMLVEDVIHLTSGSHDGGPIETPVVLGCGQVQSGDFLNGGAPDGLLGLGFGEIALPNSLAKAGLVRNSFSMCFQADDSGRIFFGDKGLASQQTTPFLPLNGTHVRYVVGLDQISVGSKTFNRKGVNIIIDSGTSFTYLPMEMYSAVTTEFDIQVQQKRAVFEDVPWQFCYKTINDDVPPPAISMVFHGGGNFSVFSPLIGIYSGNGTLDGFCLAILESSIAILGQSFMTGYQLVFDREDMKLGWSPSDCYKLEEGIGIDAAAPSDSLSPLTATPYTDAPSENAPAPFHGIPHSSGAGVSSSEDSNAARHYKAHPLYTILSILFLNQVLHAQTMHHKSTNYNQVMS